MNEALNLVVLNSIAVWLLQAFKASAAVPWITARTAKINRYVSIVFSALAAAKMVFTVSHIGSFAQGAVTLSWTGLTVANIVNFIYHGIAYFATQKTMYKVWTFGDAPAIQKA